MPTRRTLLLASPALLSAQATNKRGPALAPELVKEFVGAAHAKLERTQQMLDSEPGLLNATWDWGGGDFETALGGASHMGAREIALFLLSKGARIDLFAAAMLGKLEIVKTACSVFPEIHKRSGLIRSRSSSTPARAARKLPRWSGSSNLSARKREKLTACSRFAFCPSSCVYWCRWSRSSRRSSTAKSSLAIPRFRALRSRPTANTSLSLSR